MGARCRHPQAERTNAALAHARTPETGALAAMQADMHRDGIGAHVHLWAGSGGWGASGAILAGPEAADDQPTGSACRAHDAALDQRGDDGVGGFFGRLRGGIDAQFRGGGGFVGRVDAGEVLELAAAGLAVQALGVARLDHRERGVDEDLDELVALDHAARECAFGTEWRRRR